MSDLPFFSQRLRQLRLDARMTQRELSARSGLHQVHIAKFETGKQGPSWETVQRLARALGVPVAAFVDPEILPPELPRKPGRPRIYPRPEGPTSAEKTKRRKRK